MTSKLILNCEIGRLPLLNWVDKSPVSLDNYMLVEGSIFCVAELVSDWNLKESLLILICFYNLEIIKLGLLQFEMSLPLLDTSISYLMSKTDCVSPPLYVQILQGNARGHSGIRRHECRILRQRQTMATWNQPELWWCVPNIRWAYFLFALFRLNSG